MKIGNRNVWVFDNTNTENETFDKYTIILGNGDLLGSSDRPFAPNGFGMHCGNLVDNIMFHKYGASWRRHCKVKPIVIAEVKNYLSEARSNPNWLGIEITDTTTLPKDVISFITQNL